MEFAKHNQSSMAPRQPASTSIARKPLHSLLRPTIPYAPLLFLLPLGADDYTESDTWMRSASRPIADEEGRWSTKD